MGQDSKGDRHYGWLKDAKGVVSTTQMCDPSCDIAKSKANPPEGFKPDKCVAEDDCPGCLLKDDCAVTCQGPNAVTNYYYPKKKMNIVTAVPVFFYRLTGSWTQTYASIAKLSPLFTLNVSNPVVATLLKEPKVVARVGKLVGGKEVEAEDLYDAVFCSAGKDAASCAGKFLPNKGCEWDAAAKTCLPNALCKSASVFTRFIR